MKKQSSRLPANHMLSEIVSGLQKSRSAAHQNILRSTPIVPRPPPQYSEEKREKECKKEEQNSGANEKREEREAGVSDKGIVNAPLPNPKRRFGDGIVFWEPWNVSGGTTRNSGSQLFLVLEFGMFFIRWKVSMKKRSGRHVSCCGAPLVL